MLFIWRTASVAIQIGMSDDVEEEFAVSPAMHLLCGRRTAKRKSAQDKWPGVERELLLAVRSLFADKAD